MQSLDISSGIAVAIASVFAAVVATCYLFYFRLQRRLHDRPFQTLPMPDGGHPVFGHLPYLNPDFDEAQRWLAVSAADGAGRTGYWHAFTPGIVVSHWQDARQVLMAEEYREPLKILSKHIREFLGYNNLLLLTGKVWKHHRSAILKAFTPAGLASYRESMAQVVETMCASLEKKIDSLDTDYYETLLEPLMKMLTMDVFGLAAFSQDFSSAKTLTPSPFATAFDTLAAGMTTRFNTNPLRPSNFFYNYPSALNRRHRQAKSLLRTFLADEVSKRRSAFTKTKDLLGFMVDAHEASKDAAAGPSVNMDEVLTDIMMTILFAGYDTTSITLCYALYLVSQHENVYEQCLREINASSSLTKVEDLEYCRAVVQEALRLYPPAPSTLRLTTKPITLHDGFVVPTGTIVFIPIWSMHRLEHNFARAIEFLPERWVAKGKDGKWAERVPSDTSAANMQAFFAFSGGARNCPGGRFAVQEATILLAGLLKHLRFEALPDYKLTPGKIAVVQHPSDCLPMRISRRKVT